MQPFAWKRRAVSLVCAGLLSAAVLGGTATVGYAATSKTIESTAATGQSTTKVSAPVQDPKLQSVTKLKGSAAGSSVTLSWQKVKNATGYTIVRYDQGKKKWVTVATTNSTKYTVKDLTTAQKHNFKVKAIAKIGDKTFSSKYAALSVVVSPAKVTGLKATPATDSVKLTWSGVPRATGYLIYRYDTKAKKYIKIANQKGKTYTDKKRSAATGYKYAVKAYYTTGEKTYSGAVCYLSTATKPKKVTLSSVKRSSSKKSITLQWKKVTGSGYQIYRKAGKNGSYKLLATVDNKKTAYTDKTVSASTTYYYKVRSYKTVGKQKVYGAFSSGTQEQTLLTLKSNLESIIKKYAGTHAVYVENLSTGESFTINNRQFYAASVIKPFVMASTYQQIQNGKMKESSTIKSYLKAMITVSDNEAYNQLVKRQNGGNNFASGAKTVNNFLKKNGFTGTTVGHTLHPAASAHQSVGGSNLVTAQDCGKLLSQIYHGTCVSKSASKKMLSYLKAQQRKAKIPAGLPKGVVSANKTGEAMGNEHDMAIVYGKKTAYVVVVLSKGDGAAYSHIRAISTKVYDFLNK